VRIHRHSMLWSLAACCLVTFAAPRAWGYAEEQTDPSGQANASTHHLYLTRALAVCAGLDYAEGVADPLDVNGSVISHSQAKEAEILGFNDEMTDIGTICMQDDPNTESPEAVPFTGNTELKKCVGKDTTWTNCHPLEPFSQAAIQGNPSQCPAGSDTSAEVFPVMGAGAGAWQPALGCFSQRFSPWSPLFHFPEEPDLALLKKFGTEEAPLEARAAYAYGPSGSNLWTGSCFQRPVGAVPTGHVKPGSIEAFGMYLHSLADFNSHRMCRDKWSSKPTKKGQPPPKPTWYFHTPGPGVLPENPLGVENCGFNDHGFEYGCADSPRRAGFLNGTLNGAERVYEALLEFSAKRGKKPRIASLQANQQWLRRQLQRYVTLYQPSVLAGQGSQVQQQAAQYRIQFAWGLLQACVANANAQPDACLPDVTAAGQCPDTGVVCNCTTGAKFFPVVPACGASSAKTKKTK
jgi:hypothetical protein